MKTFEAEYRELWNDHIQKDNERLDRLDKIEHPGLDEGEEERYKLLHEFNTKLAALKKKYGKKE